jgi:hypothetical protein
MKKQTFMKYLLSAATLALAVACQPKAPVSPPVPPSEVDDSENCTDVDECSEGAMIESNANKAVESDEESASRAPAAAPVETAQPVASEPAAPAAEPVVEAPKSSVVNEAKETTSTEAPVEAQ